MSKPRTKPAAKAGNKPGSAGDKSPETGGADAAAVNAEAARTVEELGGPKGPEPTRYGDWEVGGRCSDF